MPLTNSVIRRYTPPTCTLEVLAQSSPLSRWVGKPVLKQLHFELRFDDPQLPQEQRLVIRGDRNQLEALCTAVTNYVQEFLRMSPEKFWTTFSGSEESSKASEPSPSQQLFTSSSATETLNSFSTQISTTEIHIKPSNHLTHKLFLGSLGYQTSTPVITLSLLQLFDLATALDEYSADAIALPALNQSKSPISIPAWAPAAAVLILAVGLMPLTWHYANQYRQQQKIAKKSPPAQEKVAIEPSPLLNPTPALTPTDQLPSLPLGSSLSIPGSTVPAVPQIYPTNLPSTFSSSSGNAYSLSQKTAQNLPTSQRKTSSPTSSSSQPTIPNNFPKNYSSTSASPSKKSSPTSPTTPVNISSISPRTVTATPTVASTPNPFYPNPAGFQTNLPTNSPLTTDQTSKLVERLRTNRNSSTTKVATTNSTIFDPTQVAQARDFLRKRWQPPKSLKENLEYSLIIGVDGTIERIFPLGKAAREYIDRTGMPLIGEPFVSPSKTGKATIIRAIYSPDGRVQTFAEKD